jgi:hypothetical protein
MRAGHSILPLAAAMLLGLCPILVADDLAPEILLLSKIKRKAREDFNRLSAFTCLATFDRSQRADQRKPYEHTDQVRAEVAYIDQKELFAWPGSAQFQSGTLADLIGSGLAGNGEFIAIARNIFIGDVATIKYRGAEDYRGHSAARYDFTISPFLSGYLVSSPDGSGTVGIKGSFWADRASFDLLALLALGDEIPAAIGIQSVATRIEYARTRIGAAPALLLPQTAVTAMTNESGRESRYQVEYTHCRQYKATSTISFDSDHPAVQPGAHDSSTLEEIPIPPLLVFTTRLTSPIDSRTASVGDPISATLVHDVRHKGKIILPAGAVLTGRIRLLQKDGADGFLVGLEFTDLTFAGKHARFIADLQHIDPAAGVPLLRIDKLATTEHIILRPGEVEATIERGKRETVIPPNLPGVATFLVTQKDHFQLAPGIEMEWRSSALTRR